MMGNFDGTQSYIVGGASTVFDPGSTVGFEGTSGAFDAPTKQTHPKRQLLENAFHQRHGYVNSELQKAIVQEIGAKCAQNDYVVQGKFISFSFDQGKGSAMNELLTLFSNSSVIEKFAIQATNFKYKHDHADPEALIPKFEPQSDLCQFTIFIEIKSFHNWYNMVRHYYKLPTMSK